MCRNHMHTAGIFLVYPNRCLRWMAGCFEDDIDCMMTFLSLFSICCRDNYQGWYSFLFHPVFFLNRICCPAGKSFFWHIQNHSNRFPGIQANCLVEFFYRELHIGSRVRIQDIAGRQKRFLFEIIIICLFGSEWKSSSDIILVFASVWQEKIVIQTTAINK